MAKFGKLTVFLIALVMTGSSLVLMFTPVAAIPVVSISGPIDVYEGVSDTFTGTISGYGTGTPAGYDIDDTLTETFIDASGGTVLMDYATGSSGSVETLTLPFDFKFFGVQYYAGRTIYVASNAVMDFGAPNTRHFYYYNYNIPSTSGSYPNNAVYAYWDSLRMRGASANSFVYYDLGVATSGSMAGHTYLVIEWYNVFASSYTSDPGTLEVILWDNNVIDMRYDDVNLYGSSYDYGRSATVGLENQDGTEAARYSYNTANSIKNGMNIRYTWHEAGGTGYEWKVDGALVDSGYAVSDPFSPTLSYAFPDGPAIGIIELIVTYDGAPIDFTTHTVTVHNVAPLVYGDNTYADNYAGADNAVYLGDWIYFHGYISDVAADTPPDWEPYQWVEVTPGSEGVEWEVTPYTGQYKQYWDYNWEIKFLRPGTYTATVYVMDKDGGIGWGSDEDSPRTVVVIEHIRYQWEGAGHGLKVLDAAIKPSDVQAGGMTLAYLKVKHDHPDPDVQIPLIKEDIQTLLPEDWELLNIHGPEWINGGSTEILGAAVSIPPGTPVGEYSFFVEPLPYTIPNHWHEIEGGIWCCRDDGTNGYGQYYADPLVYKNVYVDAQYLKLTHNIQADSSSGGCVLIDDGTGWALLTPLDGYVREVFALGRALDLPYTEDGPGFTYEYPDDYPEDYHAMGIDYFDLSAYYGQQVDIILMFASWGTYGYWGWNISDISLVDHTGTNVFSEDFPADEFPPVVEFPTNWDTDNRYGVVDYYEDYTGVCSDYWIDIVDPANDLLIDEDYPDQFKTIPFDFILYGQSFTQLSVTAFGYIVMDVPAYNIVTTSCYYRFPTSQMYFWYMIAPLHADISPGHGSYERGEVYALLSDTTGDGEDNQLVVTWYDQMIGYGTSTHATFQVILDNTDNSIRFNYQLMNVGTYLTGCHVGLNANDAVRCEEYYYRYSSTIVGTEPTTCTTILYTPGPVVKTSGWEVTSEEMITDSPYGDYPEAWDTYLTLKDGVYLDGDYAALEFDHMYDMDGGDYLIVEVSTDDGNTWEEAKYFDTYDVHTTPGYPTSTDHVYVDLGKYTGETILIRFHLDSDTYRASDGWYIDHVEINTYEEDLIGSESATDPRPAMTISVVGKMKGNELAYYRHTQNAMREIVVLYLNLEDGMADDGSLGAALDAYTSCDTQTAQSIASIANTNGNGYGYWVHDGGYDYFFNPGKNGNGMAGLTGKEAMD